MKNRFSKCVWPHW